MKRYIDEQGKRWGVKVDVDGRRFRVDPETGAVGAEIIPAHPGKPDTEERAGECVGGPVESADDMQED